MVTKKIEIHDFDMNSLLQLVSEDVEVLLIKDNVPVAKVSAVPAATDTKQRIEGLHAGTTWVSDDFDDPLPDEFWLGEE